MIIYLFSNGRYVSKQHILPKLFLKTVHLWACKILLSNMQKQRIVSIAVRKINKLNCLDFKNFLYIALCCPGQVVEQAKRVSIYFCDILAVCRFLLSKTIICRMGENRIITSVLFLWDIALCCPVRDYSWMGIELAF